MDGIRKITERNFWRAMFYTAMLAVSIPMIIFGAVLGLAASDHTTMSAIWVWIFIAGIF